MNTRQSLKTLLVLVLSLPVLLAVLAWVTGLLTALGDAPASAVLEHLATGIRVLWLVCLVGLVIVLSLESLLNKTDSE